MTTTDPLRIDVSAAMAPFADQLVTQRVTLERDLLGRVEPFVADLLPEGHWLVVADATTWEVAGAQVEAGLREAGRATSRYLIEPGDGEEVPVADDAKVELLRAALVASRAEEAPVAALIAVGAGTVNDIAKMAAFKADLPYAVVGTAPSMNGYTSSIAALLSDGVKTTQPCRAPVACLADLDVMAESPYRMIASGLGDLISKPVSNADWRLSFRLLDAHYADNVMVLVDEAARLLEGVAPGLAARDPEAVGRLTASLCLSGLAMSVAGTSAPASGGEHLISHYIDMTHFAFGEPHDFHGCQVGVGTITTAALYEKLAALDPSTIDVDALVRGWTPWDEHRQRLEAHFGKLASAVLPHAEAAYPSPEQLRDRLTRLVTHWDDIIADVRTTLRTAADIRGELLQARCPVTFEQIHVAPARARDAIRRSKDIRARYTILHLAAELGHLDAWADEVLAELHGVTAA